MCQVHGTLKCTRKLCYGGYVLGIVTVELMSFQLGFQLGFNLGINIIHLYGSRAAFRARDPIRRDREKLVSTNLTAHASCTFAHVPAKKSRVVWWWSERSRYCLTMDLFKLIAGKEYRKLSNLPSPPDLCSRPHHASLSDMMRMIVSLPFGLCAGREMAWYTPCVHALFS